ncbi:hypothetical protein PAPYR_1624 [Paratrimastix pyriformis]|uniref:Uncharacterized protein n=1 Tax=Paratrimastix pyriformis TaxID=342808 RepID=A0ABQ8UYT8_9EUKA|nr:hypothetical protein PAPYR_1624 [Paratrimastix pyriformis]
MSNFPISGSVRFALFPLHLLHWDGLGALLLNVLRLLLGALRLCLFRTPGPVAAVPVSARPLPLPLPAESTPVPRPSSAGQDLVFSYYDVINMRGALR